MASSVATPLERQFSTIAGLDSMTSTSSLGNTRITLQFNLSRNIDAAAQDVQAPFPRAAASFLRICPALPLTRRSTRRIAPVLYLSLSSPTLPSLGR